MRRAVLASSLVATAACGQLLGFGEDPVPSETPVESGLPDSNGGDDAGTSETSTGSSGPCDGFLFCDDFERSATLGQWEKIVTYGDAGISLSIDPAHAASPSRSLRVDVSGAAQGGSSLVRALPATTRRFEIAFSLFLEKAVGDNVHPISIAFDNASWAFLLVDTGGMSLLEQMADPDSGTKPYEATYIGNPTYGSFERMTFVVDLDAGRIELRRATGTVSTHELQLPHTAMRDVAVGAEFAYAAPSRLWLDDVAMRWQ